MTTSQDSILRKDQLEASLRDERVLVAAGALKEDNPLDTSDQFRRLCGACRRGDLKVCQEVVTEGANINARDEFDYTPLILASLCGHYEVVQLLLESGALCERDTFQGERCLYNALTDRIRNLLLEYDYSKSTDPLQPFAAHITSLLTRDSTVPSDIVVTSAEKSFDLHKFLLAARSPYFRRKLAHAPETAQWKLPATYPPQALELALRYLYLGELPSDVTLGQHTGFTEEQILEGIDKISRQLEIESLWTSILDVSNKRLARQHRTDETERGRAQLQTWFETNVLAYKITIDASRKDDVRWDRSNAIFADVLICADESPDTLTPPSSGTQTPTMNNATIPIGPMASLAISRTPNKTSVLFPAHRAVLMRAEYFRAMFGSSFAEAQHTPHLKIITVAYRPAVVEAVLAFLYAERTDFSVEIALDVLFAADELLIERLKAKTAQLLSTLGMGSIAQQNSQISTAPGKTTMETEDSDPLDPFAVLDAAYTLSVPRLETFAARYLAYRLERYIDSPDFRTAVAASAARIEKREATDSIELIDDIRYFLSERFRLRFEFDGTWLDEAADADATTATRDSSDPTEPTPAVDDESWKWTDAGQSLAVRLPTAPGGGPAVSPSNAALAQAAEGGLRTLEGDALEGDEFAQEAVRYQWLLGKIDTLLETLELDG